MSSRSSSSSSTVLAVARKIRPAPRPHDSRPCPLTGNRRPSPSRSPSKLSLPPTRVYEPGAEATICSSRECPGRCYERNPDE
ncbi:hypothetical protein MLD38_027236 [Melastoma candidum]|uniref:Uncharacterized protein n=1 Tax=Melastoma candidum TaxID=119954 RepID=A0ACB9P460_9MYRT|nr:hypothetical protein MLD38_027236 [Melastoma candidum]